VRVELDAQQVSEHPLRVGLSMEARVDVAEQSGKPLTATTAARTISTTQAFDMQQTAADRMVRDIISANLGRALAHASATAASQRLALNARR
jgi:membrane fusion protein (multidrug efflux system)